MFRRSDPPPERKLVFWAVQSCVAVYVCNLGSNQGDGMRRTRCHLSVCGGAQYLVTILELENKAENVYNLIMTELLDEEEEVD